MKKYFLITITVIAVLLTGCDKRFDSINSNPQNPDSANFNYKYLLSTAELFTSGNSDAHGFEDSRTQLYYASTITQHLASINSAWVGDKYIFNAADLSAYWDQNFGVPVKNIAEILEHTRDKPAIADLYNITRIFRVFMFQRITDMYGDIPYSQAGLGYISGIYKPKYDTQQDIYSDMLNELKEAAEALGSSTENTVGSADLIYGGDASKWKKFAYSEMLRLAMRLVKVDETSASQWANTAVTGGVMTSIDDNAIISHKDFQLGQPTVNGIAYILDGEGQSQVSLSKTLVDHLKTTVDPRLSFYGTVSTDPTDDDNLGDNSPAVQLGLPNGYDLNNGAEDIRNSPGYPGSQNDYSIVNRQTYARYDAPTFFLTFAQTALLEEEAAIRGFISQDAATLYTAGVTAGLRQMGQVSGNEDPGYRPTLAPVSDADIAAYLTKNPYDAARNIEQLNEEYWVTSFMDEYESFANFRRSGFPALTPVKYSLGSTNGVIPRRFTYAISEVSTNNANYQEAVSRLNGGDELTSRIWWDK